MVTRPRTVYGIEHLRVWRDMVDRHLSLPHEFVCITDQPEQVPDGVRSVPLWPDLLEYGGCFVRLRAFSEYVGRELIGGRFVSMDLDCAVIGNLDPIFDRPEPLVLYKMPNRVQGSMWMMDPGSYPEFWDDLDTGRLTLFLKKSAYGLIKQYIHGPSMRAGFDIGTDQSWMSYKLTQLPDAKRDRVGFWTHEDGVLNHGHALLKDPRKTPPDDMARLVFFSGPLDPLDYRNEIPWLRGCYNG